MPTNIYGVNGESQKEFVLTLEEMNALFEALQPKSLEANADLNECTTPHTTYYVDSVETAATIINKPSELVDSKFTVEVVASSKNSVFQRLTAFTSNMVSVYIRNNLNEAWDEWYKTN